MVGKVYFIYGNKSQYNGNDDGMLRILPKAMIPFAELANKLEGRILIHLKKEHIKKGLLVEISNWLKVKTGKIRLQLEVEATDQDLYILEPKNKIFPDNEVLAWLEQQGLEFHLDYLTDDL